MPRDPRPGHNNPRGVISQVIGSEPAGYCERRRRGTLAFGLCRVRTGEDEFRVLVYSAVLAGRDAVFAAELAIEVG